MIGSRMVMGSSLSFRHRANAVPAVSIKRDWSCGYETVTARDAHIRKQIEAVHPRPHCFGGEGLSETQRISRSMVVPVWLMDH